MLAVADTADLRRQLASAKASLAAARSQRTIAKGQLDDATGTDARRQARIGYENAVAQHTQAQGTVDDLVNQIVRATIVAPADGTVDAVTAVAGADLTSGPAITLSSGPPGDRRLHRERPALAQDRPVGDGHDRCGRHHRQRHRRRDRPRRPPARPATSSPTGHDRASDGSARCGPARHARRRRSRSTRPMASSRSRRGLNGSALNGYSVQVVGADGSAQARDAVVGLITSTQADQERSPGRRRS